MEKLLTRKEAAELLNVNLRTVQRLEQAGHLVSIKVGRVYRIRPEDLQAYLENNKWADVK